VRQFAEAPLKTTLTVMAVMSGVSLDSAANGDILLLGDFTTTPTRFYCAVRHITKHRASSNYVTSSVGCCLTSGVDQSASRASPVFRTRELGNYHLSHQDSSNMMRFL